MTANKPANTIEEPIEIHLTFSNPPIDDDDHDPIEIPLSGMYNFSNLARQQTDIDQQQIIKDPRIIAHNSDNTADYANDDIKTSSPPPNKSNEPTLSDDDDDFGDDLGTFALPNLNRQITDNEPKQSDVIDNNQGDNIDVDNSFDALNIPSIQRQLTDNNDTHRDNIGDNLGNDKYLPNLMNIQRQITDNQNNNNDNDDIGDDLGNDAIDAFKTLPNLSGFVRQVTDQNQNPEKSDDSDDNNDNDKDPNYRFKSLPNLFTITRQLTDNNQNDDDNNQFKSLPNVFKMDRQITDKQPDDNVQSSETDQDDDFDDDNNDNMMFKSMPNVFKIERQVTDKQPDIIPKRKSIDNEFTSMPNLFKIQRQVTDKQADISNNNIDKVDDDDGVAYAALPNLNDISRQTTDHAAKTDDDINQISDKLDIQNEEEIIIVPPRVPSSANDINDNDINKPIDNNLNQYLDSDLVLFDQNGNLLDDNQPFVNTLTGNNPDVDVDAVSVAVLDNSTNQFIEHTEPIMCMALNPKKKNEIITGGQDEKCYIWNIITFDPSECIKDDENTSKNDEKIKDKQEKKVNLNSNKNKKKNTIKNVSDDITNVTGYYVIDKHSDTIIDCSWNTSGKYLGIGSMDNTISIYNYTKNMKLMQTLNIGAEVSYIHWHPNINQSKTYRNILMTGAYDKNIWLHKYNKNNKKFEELQVLRGHSSEVVSGNFTKYNNGSYAYSGDKDGVIIIWEDILSDWNGKKKYIFKPGLNSNDNNNYHESDITSMDDCISSPLLISGSADGTVVLINYESGTILNKLGKHKESVESVKFNKNYKQKLKYTHYASSSSIDGCVKIYDLNQGIIRNELKHNNGVVVHEWFNKAINSHLIATGCMDGIVYVWNTKTGQIIKQFKGHSNTIQTLKITDNDDYIITGGDDSKAMVWKY